MKIINKLYFYQKKINAALTEDDPEDLPELTNGLQISEKLHPTPGGPFSALTSSMWPENLLAKLEQPETFDPNDNKECQFDEFGFRIEDEEGSQSCTNKVTFDIETEDDQQRF